MLTATRIGLAMIGALSVALPAGARDADARLCANVDIIATGDAVLGACSRALAGEARPSSEKRPQPHPGTARGPALELAQMRGAAGNEDTAWETARKTNTEDAYIRFLEEFPAGNHAGQARQALDALSKPADPRPNPPRDLARDPPAGTQPDPGARRPPPAPDPAPAPAVPSPAAPAPSGRAFAWNYDERGGILTVTTNGQTQTCTVLNPGDYAGVGVYLSDGRPRVNFDRQRPAGRPSSDDLQFDAFCAEASAVTPLPPPPAPPPPAPTPEPEVKSRFYTIRLCNRSSEATIDTAVAHFVQATDDDVTVVGWWIIPRGECMNVRTSPFGNYENMHFYVHANTSKYSWPGKSSSDLNLCTTGKAFSRKNTANYRCKKGETLRYFKKVTVSRDYSETTVSTFSFND
jgi:uncharacterized membrane protein